MSRTPSAKTRAARAAKSDQIAGSPPVPLSAEDPPHPLAGLLVSVVYERGGLSLRADDIAGELAGHVALTFTALARGVLRQAPEGLPGPDTVPGGESLYVEYDEEADDRPGDRRKGKGKRVGF